MNDQLYGEAMIALTTSDQHEIHLAAINSTDLMDLITRLRDEAKISLLFVDRDTSNWILVKA